MKNILSLDFLFGCAEKEHFEVIHNEELQELFDYYVYESLQRGKDPNPMDLSFTIKFGGSHIGTTIAT